MIKKGLDRYKRRRYGVEGMGEEEGVREREGEKIGKGAMNDVERDEIKIWL